MHIFSCPRDWPGLSQQASVDEFTEEHGASSRRRDCEGKEWHLPKGQARAHGSRTVTILGSVLQPSGFHWDVQARKDTTITDGYESWKKKVSSAHINIYPDGYLRVNDGWKRLK